MRKMTITVATDGQATIEAHEYVGSACSKATEPLVAGLLSSPNDTKKPEYYSPEIGTTVPVSQ